MTDKPVETPDVKPEEVKPDVKPNVDSIPYARFKEINDALKESNETITQMKANEKAKKDKELESQGKYKTLLEERDAELEVANKKASEWDTYQEARRKSLIDVIPEDDRDIYKGLSLEALEKHVIKIGKKPVVPGVDNTTPGEAEAMGYATPQEAALALNRGEIKQELFDKIMKFFRSKVK